jgi:hypothetical protein
MGNARQHHYVQAAYLEGFLAPGEDMLWTYGRRRLKPYRGQPDTLASQRDFYNIPNAPSGVHIESYLEKSIEEPGLAALRRLTATKQPPDVNDRIALARYISFQEMRVPYAREITREHALRSTKDLAQSLRKSGLLQAEVESFAIAEGRRANRGSRFTVTQDELNELMKEMQSNPDTFDLEDMIKSGNEHARFFAAMSWEVLSAKPPSAFLTSDHPVFRSFANAGGEDALLRRDVSVCCPLDANTLLVMKHDLEYLAQSSRDENAGVRKLPPITFKRISPEGLANFNRKIAENAHRWCFSGRPSDWLIKILQGPGYRRKPEFRTMGNGTLVRMVRGDG